MSKNIYGRRMERISIDGHIHLVRTRWANPADEHDIRCAFCRSEAMEPKLDIIQRGISDDRVRTFILCGDCGHVTEYRYTVECFQGTELSV